MKTKKRKLRTLCYSCDKPVAKGEICNSCKGTRKEIMTNIWRRERKEYSCKCGKKCIDNYKKLNKFNKRIYCDECVNKFWKERKILSIYLITFGIIISILIISFGIGATYPIRGL